MIDEQDVTPVQTEPAQTAPVQTEPAQTAPVQTEPAQTAPVQTEPAQTAANQQDAPPRRVVSFYRSHDAQHELTGEVVQIKSPDDDDAPTEILVKTKPDGVLVWTNSDHIVKD